MEYTQILILLLTTITAVVTLKKSTVELRSAQAKLAADAASKAAPPQTSARNHRTSLAAVIFASVLLLFSMATLLWLAFGPLAGTAPTLKDLALVGMCVINVIQAYRWI